MNCPTCHQELPAPADLRAPVIVRGKKYVAQRTQRLSPVKYCGKGYTRAVPVIVIEQKEGEHDTQN